MVWYHLIAYFFAGVFLANFVPHFVTGVLGRTMPTPFASPPFRGQSSSRVNILWGLCNLVVFYVLLSQVGTFEPSRVVHAVPFGLGLGLMGFFIAGSFERSRRRQETG